MAATTSAANTPRARALSAALREARLAKGVGQRELARMLSISHTDLSLWENSRRVPNVEQVVMILTALRVEPVERERILDLARSAREPNWLTVGMSGITQQLAGAIESERAASAITEWRPGIVPGLLQIPDYARVIVSQNGRVATDVEPRLLLRVGRQEILTRGRPTRFDVLLGELALREPIASPLVMAEQLDHLVRMCDRPNITIWIVPALIGWHPGSAGPFILYDFPDSPSVVHLEHFSSGAFVPDVSNVRDYQYAVSALKDLAMAPDESISFIAQIAAEWRERNA